MDYNLKAVVFDDREEEAEPLIKALNYERIPNIYINFEHDTREDQKLKNIRIVFADLILGGQTAGDPETVIESIRASILDNIDIDNGPFILITWSKNSEFVSTLEKRILEEKKLNFVTLKLDKKDYFIRNEATWQLKQGFTIDNINESIQNKLLELEKKEYVNEDNKSFLEGKSFENLIDDLKQILEIDKNNLLEQNDATWQLKDGVTFKNICDDIIKELSSLDYLNIFLEWENDARDSISKVLNSLLDNVSEEAKIKTVVSSAIKSTLGQEFVETTSKEKLIAFYYTLNSILSDSIENNTTPENKHDTFLEALDLDNIDFDMKAIINSKTLFEETNDDTTIKNGNIYYFQDFQAQFSQDVLEEVCGNQLDSVFTNDFFVHNPVSIKDEKGKVIHKSCSTFESALEEEVILGNKKFNEKCKEYIKSMIYPVLMEFTPSCDIANKKYNKSRLILGYLVDSRAKCMKRKSDSLYLTDFHFNFGFTDKIPNSNYRLAFFIKNIFAVNPDKVRTLYPLIRARKEFVTDLQHSIANHISRIGISSLDGF